MKKDKIAESAETALMSGQRLTWRQFWSLIKIKFIQLLGGLIMEKDDEGMSVISLGRVSWWIVFVPAVGIWIASGGKLNAGEAIRDISPNHFNLLMILAGYNFSKKLTDTAKMFIGNKGTAQKSPLPLPQTNGSGPEANDPKPPSGRWD